LSGVVSQTIIGLRRRVAAEIARRIPRGGVGRNAVWSIGGQTAGLLATLIATPIQLTHMGAERYGIVVITAATMSSLVLVDAGAGWAVQRAVPWHRARGDYVYARRLAASGLLLTIVAGCLAGAAIWTFASDIVDVFRLSASVRPEAVAALHVAAFTLPLTLVFGLFIAVGRAAEQFPLIATSSALMMVALNVVWALVAGEHNDVVLVARAQLVITAGSVMWLLLALRRRARSYLFPLRPSLSASRELLSFGGKSSVGHGSLVLLYQADKVALATVLPVAVLPAYSIPFNVALRITVVSQALAGVLLPRLSAISSRGDLAEMRRVGMAALRAIALAIPAVAVACVFGGRAFLELWVSPDFAEQAWGPLIALAIGFAALAIGSFGQATLDASGRPGINAALTVIGAAVGLGLAVGLASRFGTALAAGVGMACGLVVIAGAALEMSRRLVLRITWRTLLGILAPPWLSLGAAGTAALGASSALAAPPLLTLALVALATAAATVAFQIRREAASSANPPR
jgi:O-antigen/teichoic acid export membrane protein